ncbi:MAG: hypothetical protein R3F14_44610 [Polyangiaceae bacterium]
MPTAKAKPPAVKPTTPRTAPARSGSTGARSTTSRAATSRPAASRTGAATKPTKRIPTAPGKPRALVASAAAPPTAASKPRALVASAAAPPTAASKTRALAASAAAPRTAAQEKAESLLDVIARRKQRIAEDFYDIGEALRDLQKKKLFAALGYESFADMLEARKVMSLTQAHKLIRIVTTLPRAKALAVGSEKAAILVGYSEATPEPDTPEWLLDQGTLPGGKPVAEASTRELKAAVKQVRAKVGKKAPKPEEKAARSQAKSAQAALRKRGAKKATAEAVRKAGKWWVRVELPAESAGVLAG